MVKINKYFILTGFLVLIFGTILFLTLQKFSPLFFKHTVYYCQSLVHSFSMQVPKNLGLIFAGTIFILVAISFFRFILSYLRMFFLRGNFAMNIKTDRKFNLLLNELDLEDKAFLIKSVSSFALCMGIRNPKIYISSKLFNEVNKQELKAILLHEKHHLENKDSLTLLFSSTVESIFPFFPILNDILRNLRIESELKADESTIACLGTKKPLISVLKKLLRDDIGSIPAFIAAIAVQETIDIRIKKLIGVRYSFRKFKLRNITISLGSLFLLFGLLVAPVQAINTQTKDGDIMMVCLQGGECSNWCKENRTAVPYTPAFNFTPLDK